MAREVDLGLEGAFGVYKDGDFEHKEFPVPTRTAILNTAHLERLQGCGF